MTCTTMRLATTPYLEQAKRWPQTGRHVLAQYDQETVVVYQTYRPEIGNYAAKNQHFRCPEFSLSRMSWIKPNFLWMMYRSGWGMKEGQETTLALRIRRTFFETLLEQAVESTFDPNRFNSRSEWERAVASSSVRFQWDPDHHPSGANLERRALQLGLRQSVLEAFSQRELLEVLDISEFVADQRRSIVPDRLCQLVTPSEEVYLPKNAVVSTRLGLDGFQS